MKTDKQKASDIFKRGDQRCLNGSIAGGEDLYEYKFTLKEAETIRKTLQENGPLPKIDGLGDALNSTPKYSHDTDKAVVRKAAQAYYKLMEK